MNQSSGTAQQVQIECAASAGFQAWMAEAGGSLALSTYQAGKVAVIGWDGRQVSLLMRQFDKPLGLAVDGAVLALAHRHDVTLFANASLLAHDYQEDQPGKYDALYLPRATWHTGDLHTHDIAFVPRAGSRERGARSREQGAGSREQGARSREQGAGSRERGAGSGESKIQNPKSKIELLLVNTRFSCLARLSEEYNFEPVWRPRFVSDLVPEDRCHLNGLAVVDGRPKYVTALGTTDTPGGWRQHKADGGVLVDVETDETILAGLSMPHSPRWYGGRLWVLNSGTGELLLVDPAGGKSEAVCGLRGYLRGLAFVGPYALVGLCKIREKHIFGGLPIQKRHEKLLCGVVVVDLRRGAEVGMFEFTSGCEELYDVQFLPGVRRPMILNLDKPAVRQAVTNPDSSYWLRASAEIHEETKPSSLS